MSFLPNRKNSGRKATPTPPPTDPDATAVQPGWSSMLQEHLKAQPAQPPRPILSATVPAPVEVRHYSNDETQAFQKPEFNDTEEYVSYMRANSPKPVPPPPAYAKPSPSPSPSPSDLTQIMQQVQAFKPMEELRSLRYFGPNNAILVVVGYQIHFAHTAGVVITENGPGVTTATLIPWRRVYELNARLDDPILKARS